MNSPHCLKSKRQWIAVAAMSCGLLLTGRAAEMIVNGGFESGLTSWTLVDQIGSEGTFYSQSGTSSPVLSTPVPTPPEGSSAAMTDAAGPGSHVMYQDFLVAIGSSYTLDFSLFIGNLADAFYVPSPDDTLDFATPALNQQARVDILTSTSDPFSVAAADVLQTVYRTDVSDPLISGYTDLSFDLTALLEAHQGQTLRLRFAEVDNVNIFNFGVDQVSLTTGSMNVPDTVSFLPPLLSMLGVLVLGSLHRRRLQTATHRA